MVLVSTLVVVWDCDSLKCGAVTHSETAVYNAERPPPWPKIPNGWQRVELADESVKFCCTWECADWVRDNLGILSNE